jgi:hypothetical protein
MLTVELLHAAVESPVIASVRGFRAFYRGGRRDRSGSMRFRRRMIALSPIKQIISESRKKGSCNRVRFDLSSVEESSKETPPC